MNYFDTLDNLILKFDAKLHIIKVDKKQYRKFTYCFKTPEDAKLFKDVLSLLNVEAAKKKNLLTFVR
jgi:hypothetical protein